MTFQPEKRPSGPGFTLVEIVVSVTLLGLVGGGIMQMTLSGTGAFRTGATLTNVETRNARALERMVRELSLANAASLNPPDPAGGDWIEFTGPGTPETVRFRVELAPGEVNNGVDDNGDGLVDEGVLVRIEDLAGPNQKRVILARGVAELLEGELPNAADDNGNLLVDEGGLTVTVQAAGALRAVTLALTLQERGPSGELFERTLITTVVLRN